MLLEFPKNKVALYLAREGMAERKPEPRPDYRNTFPGGLCGCDECKEFLASEEAAQIRREVEADNV